MSENKQYKSAFSKKYKTVSEVHSKRMNEFQLLIQTHETQIELRAEMLKQYDFEKYNISEVLISQQSINLS